jgi:aldehyde dehydrogenase (NAD+)
LINGAQFARVRGYLDRGKRDAVGLLARSTLPGDLPGGGFYVEPTLFGPVHERHELACSEVFGPVLSAMPFADESDAIRLANATEYGLVAGLWTENGSRQTRVSRAMRVGQVFINCYGAGGGIELPFGGFKRSGHGRGKGFAAMHEFSTLQTITQKYS